MCPFRTRYFYFMFEIPSYIFIRIISILPPSINMYSYILYMQYSKKSNKGNTLIHIYNMYIQNNSHH